MIARGAIHGNYPGVEVVTRSHAHCGFQVLTPFEDGDPEWSRRENHWSNIDQCNIGMSWQVQKVSREILWNFTLVDRVPGPASRRPCQRLQRSLPSLDDRRGVEFAFGPL
jgi:hypothetical protein